MKKWLVLFSSIMIAFALLMVSSTDDDTDQGTTENPTNEAENAAETDQNNEEQEEIVHFTLSIDEGDEVITEKEVPISEGDLLMDVLKANFDVEEEGGFITSIEGVAPEEDEEKSWMFFVNDEMATVGAQEVELNPGDQVTFDLQAWE